MNNQEDCEYKMGCFWGCFFGLIGLMIVAVLATMIYGMIMIACAL